MFIILITFSLGFSKKVKEIVYVVVVREEIYTHMKPLETFSMQNIRTSMLKRFLLCRAAAHKR